MARTTAAHCSPGSSSQVDELEEDPQFAPQLQLPPPKPKRQRTKATASKSKAVTAAPFKSATAQVTKPAIASTSKRVEQQQQPPSSGSSGTLERFRYQKPPAALEEKDKNAKSKPTRKRSREKEPKGAAESASEAPAPKREDSKRRKKEEVVFTMPELDEDGEPIFPTPVKAASRPAEGRPSPFALRGPPSPSAPIPKSTKQVKPPSSDPSSSSIGLPSAVKARIRAHPPSSNSERQLPSPAMPTLPSQPHSDTLRVEKSSGTSAHAARSLVDEEQIADCLAALEDDGGLDELFGLDDEEAANLDSRVVADPSEVRRTTPRSSSSVENEGVHPSVADEDAFDDFLPSLGASPIFPSLDLEAEASGPAVVVPPRLNAQAFDLLLAGAPASSHSKSEPNPHRSTPPGRATHPSTSTAPRQDLLAALAANPAPPPPRVTHRLVPLTPSGLVSHLEALLDTSSSETSSLKARVKSLEASLAARDAEIGHLSEGLRTVKGERAALEVQAEEGRKEVEGWKGKVDLLKEVRRGLLSELQEEEERIAELESEREVAGVGRQRVGDDELGAQEDHGYSQPSAAEDG